MRGPCWLLIAALGAAGCRNTQADFPAVRDDDAGNHSWARQAIPALFGRKARGREEIKLVADLVAATDRPSTVRALSRHAQFTDYWTEAMVDLLHVDREPDLAFDDIVLDDRSLADCYGAPLRAGAPTGALAQHILTSAPSTAAAGGAFNMSDVVRSAIQLDNLAPMSRAHLFASQHNPPDQGGEQDQRNELGRVFMEDVLHRQMLCLNCHNSHDSTTGPDSGWTRHFPITGYFEMALYGAHQGTALENANAMFRTDQHQAVPGGSFAAPWGMSGCGGFLASGGPNALGNPYFTGPLANGATVTTLAGLFKTGYDGLAANGLDRSVPPENATACNFCASSCSGGSPANPETFTNGTFVRDIVTDKDDTSIPAGAALSGGYNCGECHGGEAGLWFADGPDPWYSYLINQPANGGGTRVIPGNAANSILIKKLRGTAPGARMPYGCTGSACLSDAEITKIEQWINSLPSSAACTSCPSLDCNKTHVGGEEAFAFLVAAHLVESVWSLVMGYPVTVANYFSRNFGQRQVLWNLTENEFIPDGWSLRELVTRILTSKLFNRHAPFALPAGKTPYELPMLYDPWVAADPRVPPVTSPGYKITDHPADWNNAMSDGVQRYTAFNLLRSVQHALDWPAPPRFPSASGYPDRTLQYNIGQYLSTTTPGFRPTNFAALLQWEKVQGRCVKKGGGTDWIDRVVTAARGFTPAPGDPPLTLQDLMVVERDWLLGDGTLGASPPPGLSDSELTALDHLVGALATEVSGISDGDLQTKLRDACGVMLESPQFLLAGIAPEQLGPAPRLRVCNSSPCSYKDMCQEYAPLFTLPPGTGLVCGDNSVSVVNLVIPWPKWRDLCPEGICGPTAIKPGGCFRTGEACRIIPPACDPRCSRADCCGGPLPPEDKQGIFVTYGDGATVKQAKDVRIVRAGSGKPEALTAGAKLAYGDLLEVPPTAELVLVGTDGKVISQQKPDATRQRPAYLMISGAAAIQQAQAPAAGKPLTAKQLDWLRQRGRLRYPDGAKPSPLKPSDRAPAPYERKLLDEMQRKELRK